MATPQETIWDIEPHTVAKHEILRRYLQAWFPILNRYHGKIVYIDGFCGPGRYKGGEPGSPLIALDAAMNHIAELPGELVFWFIDERSDRVDHLNLELAELPLPSHFEIHANYAVFHEKLDEILRSSEYMEASPPPTFAFIDPFGFKGIPFSLIRRLLAHKRCEVLITFMVGAINRFLEHPDKAIVSHVVDLFGTRECVEIAEEATNRPTRLRALYQKQLAEVAKYVRLFEMRSVQDRPLYFLFFASNHRLGHIRMKEAMWTVDAEGAFRFSDATDPNQMILFDASAGQVISTLEDELRKEFGGKGAVQVLQIRQFVEDSTACLKKHMNAALKLQESEGKIKVHDYKSDGKKRRKGTFPNNAVLEYL